MAINVGKFGHKNIEDYPFIIRFKTTTVWKAIPQNIKEY